jgi:hypothetical protein
MASAIIKQEDGKFGLFTTVSDTIYAFDCDEKEMVRIWKERAAERAEQEMKQWLEEVKTGHDWRGTSMTFKEALEQHICQNCSDDEWNEKLKAKMKELGVKNDQ